ncbi:MAG: type 2 lantipeptide synthetase LanM family protein [Rivularia sp. (in: Bacteria)]|nr:type 2 lantipeptide synthetase LanM family protein [Rivularia sp. MS3]
MNKSLSQNSAWYLAIPLAERISSLNAFEDKIPNVAINTECANKRLKRWQTQIPFTSEFYFNQRLATDCITEDQFFYLLGEPVEALKERFPNQPEWLVEFTKAFSNPPVSDLLMLRKSQKAEDKESFLDAIEPLKDSIKQLINRGRKRLRQGVECLLQTQDIPVFSPDTIEELFLPSAPQEMLWMLSRTLTLELNVARLQGLLQGKTSEERFQSFTQRLQQPDVLLALFQEYPVLARQLTIYIDQWVNYSLEFLHHLCIDWVELQAIFSPDKDLGSLVELDVVGDKHRDNRCVMIVKFSSGLQIVYKPRYLAVDVHFQELLTWINERSSHPPFRTLKILDRGFYGWVEFVTASECRTAKMLRQFYERQGGYLALLYALNATDFHSENLIAAGEDPVLVDLESLFHQCFETANLTESNLLASKIMNDSVLSIGLLPQRIHTDAEFEGIDLSGLGAVEGQLTPHRLPYWEGKGTDEMQIKRKRFKMLGDHNRPSLNGKKINILDYTESIITGFTNIYQLLLKYKDELLNQNGSLARFSEDKVRIILRSTYIYDLLLSESFHPDFLRNALDRDRLFDSLWLGIEQEPYLAKVIAAEKHDLWCGDIPLFTTKPNSRDLWSSCGERIADFFAESGMNLVQRRLQKLSDTDLKQQLWFIRASLTTLITTTEETTQQSTLNSITQEYYSTSREQLLLAAKAVGDRLEILALRSEHDATWIGLQPTPKDTWFLTALNMDMYSGLSGVALFLAYLGEVTAQEHYTSLAKATLTKIRRQMEQNQSFVTCIGAFDGWGGIIYTLSHLSTLWNQPVLLTEAEKITSYLPELIKKDEQFDIISGAAGCIGSLITLYRCAPFDHILDMAIQCGDHLIASAQPMKNGVAWSSKTSTAGPLGGFSHGTSGIAWALLELSSLTGEKRFQTTALKAIEYERSLFVPKFGNWLDLRNFSTQVLEKNDNHHNCMTAWCHGAPGIGLSRLLCLLHLDDAEVRSEINTALNTTINNGFGDNHSLCHGDLGNLELLLQASLILDNPQWKTKVDHFAGMILESINQHGWLCGVPLGVENPGLMTGLAGIGYELLRLAAPEIVPSVLGLESPKVYK